LTETYEERITTLEQEKKEKTGDILTLRVENERLGKEIEDLKGQLGGLTQANRMLAIQIREAEPLLELKNALEKIFPAQVKIPASGGSEPMTPSEISVTTQQPVISLRTKRPLLAVTGKDLLGKITKLYGKGELGTDWFTVSDLTRLFEKHAWARDPRASSVLDDMVRWDILEKRLSGKRPEYKVAMSPEDAKSKGFLKVEEH